MNRLYIAALLLFFCMASTSVVAQVTVGSAAEPEKFSILQVDGDKGGIRLPRMSTAEMNAVKTSLITNQDPEAVGLVVYNKDNGVDKLAFWDGSDWIYLEASIKGENGLTDYNNGAELRLGGALLQKDSPTIIEQNGYDFNISDSGTASTATASIGSISVEGDKVTMSPATKLSINGSALNVNVAGKTTTIDAKNVSINTNALVVDQTATGADRQKIVVTGAMKFTNNNAVDRGYIFSSDEEGNASWQPSRPFGSVVKGRLNNSKAIPEDIKNETYADITEEELTLTPGQWIIFAKCTTKGRNASSTKIFYHWMDLMKVTGRNTQGQPIMEKVLRTGQSPELNTGGTDVYATPNLMYYVNIDKKTAFRVLIASTSEIMTTTTYGNSHESSYFYAIKLDVADKNAPTD